MAVTEITKILFRRGTEKDRDELANYGGLAQGEPGFTSSQGYGGFAGQVDNTGQGNVDPESAFLKKADVVTWDTTKGGGDFFIGSKEGYDVYIGGSSSERHYQRYFVSLSGTGYNHGFGSYIAGNLHVGAAGNSTDMTTPTRDDYSVKFYGSTNRGGYQNLVEWNPEYGVFHIDSETALKLPVGTTAQRPNTTGNYQAYGGHNTTTALTGMMRFNTSTTSFEGHNGTTWTPVGGAMSVDRRTFITFESPVANTSACASMSGAAHEITFTTDCGYAGKFDVSGNFEVVGDTRVRGDIVAAEISNRFFFVDLI